MEKDGYDAIAAEYYDPFHRTCRNFDKTTVVALSTDPITVPSDGLVLEVGCGRGRCIEFLGLDESRIIQLDSSREMLEIKDRERCYLRLHVDATSIPLLDAQFTAVVGFLIDPFMGLNFFAEAYRLLVSEGLFFVTTPTAEWGDQLREEIEIEASLTRFVTKDKATVIIPSTLIPENQIEEMLAHIGFQQISVTKHCLPDSVQPISDDIRRVARRKNIDVHDLPIIHFVQAIKP